MLTAIPMDKDAQNNPAARRQLSEASALCYPELGVTAAGETVGNHVLILDQDPSVLTVLNELLSSNGYQVHEYTMFSDLRSSPAPTKPACLLLDNQSGKDLTGQQAFEELLQAGWTTPTIFLAANWSPRAIVEAIKAGAEGFIVKPIDPVELLDEVAKALQSARANHQTAQRSATARALAEQLTERELEVVKWVMKGLLNKEIASELGLALVTVKVHRGRAMRKLQAGNSAEFVRIAGLAGLTP